MGAEAAAPPGLYAINAYVLKLSYDRQNYISGINLLQLKIGFGIALIKLIKLDNFLQNVH